MAGLNTPPGSDKLLQKLGVDASVKRKNVIAYLISSVFSIASLVFLNSSQSFVLSNLLLLPPSKIGSISGTLILADELLAIPSVIFWGFLSDVLGIRFVTCLGHLLVSVGLVVFIQPRKVWPDLLVARLFFSFGASALVTMLSAILASMSSISSPSSPSSSSQEEEEQQQQHENHLNNEEEEEGNENQPLLPERDVDSNGDNDIRKTEIVPQSHDPTKASRLAGMVGFSTGLGALLAVFLFLRLPPLIAKSSSSSNHNDDNPNDNDNSDNNSSNSQLKEGLIITFYIVAFIELLVAIGLWKGLEWEKVVIGGNGNGNENGKRDENPNVRNGNEDEETYTLSENNSNSNSKNWSWLQKMKKRNSLSRFKSSSKNFLKGFWLVKDDPDLALAYVGSFAARAQTVVVTVFIPVYVNWYFLATGQCQLDSPEVPKQEVKNGCHEAFALSSSITGVIQLLALLSSPPLGYLASLTPLTIFSLLSFTFLISTIGFFGFAFLPLPSPTSLSLSPTMTSAPVTFATATVGASSSSTHPGPTHPTVWIWAILIGMGQMGGIVGSLGMLARARTQLVRKRGEEVGGSVSGVSSLAGGLGIIVASRVGGALFDISPMSKGAPFFLMGIIDALAMGTSLAFYFVRRRQQGRKGRIAI